MRPLLLLLFLLSVKTVNTGVWDVVTWTCDVNGAGTTDTIYLKVESAHDEEHLKLHHSGSVTPFAERNQYDQFRIRLKHDEFHRIGLYMKGRPKDGYGSTCVRWVLMMNSWLDTCVQLLWDGSLDEEDYGWLLVKETNPATRNQTLPFRECVSVPTVV